MSLVHSAAVTGRVDVLDATVTELCDEFSTQWAVTGRVDVLDATVTELCDEFSTQRSRDWAGRCTRRNSHCTKTHNS